MVQVLCMTPRDCFVLSLIDETFLSHGKNTIKSFLFTYTFVLWFFRPRRMVYLLLAALQELHRQTAAPRNSVFATRLSYASWLILVHAWCHHRSHTLH